jgi:uncharacterized protein YicC (UPF0701 family)
MMNNLTNDMTRLCGEIAALRDNRIDLMIHIAETRAEMQAAVTRTLAGFAEARSDMAKQAKADLSGFVVRVKEAVTELRQRVASLQDEFRDDLAGAHRAWHGAGLASRTLAPTAAESPLQAKEASDDLTPKGKKKKR